MEGRDGPQARNHTRHLRGGEREPGRPRARKANERRNDLPRDRPRKSHAAHALEEENVWTTSHGMRTAKLPQDLSPHPPGEGPSPTRRRPVRWTGRRNCGSAPDRFPRRLCARGPLDPGASGRGAGQQRPSITDGGAADPRARPRAPVEAAPDELRELSADQENATGNVPARRTHVCFRIKPVPRKRPQSLGHP